MKRPVVLTVDDFAIVKLGEEVLQAICHDFFMNTTRSAPLTWYVLDTTLNITCCQPQVLTFENREHAEKSLEATQ